MTEPGRSGGTGQIQDDLSVCPTFSSYSSDRLAEIAARVTDEFKGESENLSVLCEDDDDDDEDDDFEFSLMPPDDHDVFSDGRIFPVFNRRLLPDDGDDKQSSFSSSDVIETKIRIPLKNLFIQDREERQPPSSSSSEADEMESIPPGTYCVWRPKNVESSPSQCKKSQSTGSASKRWKFLDLLRRSNSEGKDTFVFLTPKHREAKKSEKTEHPKATQTSGEVAKAERKSPSAHEAFYVRNRAIKQVDKKKSYLPYRQELVGLFANVNGLSTPFPPC